MMLILVGLLFLISSPFSSCESISFIVSGDEGQRKSIWNGESMRSGGAGVSGSETAFVVFAEYWASKGHQVILFSSYCNESTVNAVQYTKNISLAIHNVTTMVILPWFQLLPSMTAPTTLKYLIVNYQGIGVPHGLYEFSLKHKNVQILSIYPSNWAQRAVINIAKKRSLHLEMFSRRSFIVYNPLLTDVLEKVDHDAFSDARLDRSFVWAAAFERGGSTALRAFRIFNGSRFEIMTYIHIKERTPENKVVYLDPELTQIQRKSHQMNSKVHVEYGADKLTVLKAMKRNSYFLYPLTLSASSNYPGSVHKDTFALCVAEALAVGAIVITWPVAALTEIYPEEKSGVVFLQFPVHVNTPSLTGYDFVSEPVLVSNDALSIMVQTLRRLESDPVSLEARRRKGMAYSRNSFGVETVRMQLSAIRFG